MAYVDPTSRTQSDLITEAIWNQDVVTNMQEISDGEIIFVVDGGGSELSTGIVARAYFTHAYTIEQQTTAIDQTGSIVLDLWVDIHANYPPTVADTITASAKPTISSGLTDQDGTLTGWTTSIAAGDWMFVNIDSVTTAQYVTLVLKLKRAS